MIHSPKIRLLNYTIAQYQNGSTSSTMSNQQLTYESVLELIRENSREFSRSLKEQAAEFDRRTAEIREQMQKTDRRIERTNRQVGELNGSMGKVIERMVAGQNIAKQFQEKFGYVIESHSRNKTFGDNLPKGLQGEIDLFLENGDIAIVIEVKTTFKAKNVGSLKDKLEKFRRASDLKGDRRRFIGAIAGAVIEGDAAGVAHENGFYVIVQSGKAVEIVPVPEGFKAREW